MSNNKALLRTKIISVLPASTSHQNKADRIVKELRTIVIECQLQSNYRILGKKGEGTFSEVLKCQSIKDGQMFACKKMKQKYETIEQVCNLREVQAMRRLNPHVNVIQLHEIIFDRRSGIVALVCELMEMNLYELIRGRRKLLAESVVKRYMFQLLKALDHMHKIGIFHRDIKPENILLRDDNIKLADFGSVRSVYSKPPYTEYISTRWYRAPECLLTDGYYSYKMDIWSVGCCFHEILCLHPLFPGQNEIDQVGKIHDILGTPAKSVLDKFKHRNHAIDFNFPQKKGSGIEKALPHVSQTAIDIIYKLVEYDFEQRITAKTCLNNAYFRELRDQDKKKSKTEVANMPSSPRLSSKQFPNKSSQPPVPVMKKGAASTIGGGGDQNKKKPTIKDTGQGRTTVTLPKIPTVMTKNTHGAGMLVNAQKELNKQHQGYNKFPFSRNSQNSGATSTYKNFLNKKPNQAGYPAPKLSKGPGASYKYGPTLPAFNSKPSGSTYSGSQYKPNYLSSSKQYQNKQSGSKTNMQASSNPNNVTHPQPYRKNYQLPNIYGKNNKQHKK